MNGTQFALVPRDGLFCKDGRGWHTSQSGRGYSLDWPWPSTIAGSLRTAFGRMREVGRALTAEEWKECLQSLALGPSLALWRSHAEQEWAPKHRVWPSPADALLVKGRSDISRLDPLPMAHNTLGRDEVPTREKLWWPVVDAKAKPETMPRWWDDASFVKWLCGKEVNRHAPGYDQSRRIQVHVGMNAETQTAEESILFSHDVIETLEQNGLWAIGIKTYLKDELERLERPSLVTLGSDGRLARVETTARDLFSPPQSLVDAFGCGSRGLRLVVVTPALFSAGWLPDGFASRCDHSGVQKYSDQQDTEVRDYDMILRAAFVPRPINVSGWDMAAGGPKSTDRMVPPGAVYFFERSDEKPFDASDVKSFWLAALGGRKSDGYGIVVPGIWTPPTAKGTR